MLYCEPCDRYFYSDSAYQSHCRDSSRHHYCDSCDRDFVSSAALNQHYIHSSSHNYCEWCEEDFDTPSELEEHDDDAHYCCGECDDVFQSESELDTHIEDNHWYCKSCDKFFKNEHNLNQHLNNSNAHKPRDYVCPGRGCSSGFISWSALLRHCEAGACPSGLNREQLNKLVVRADRNNLVTNASRLITGPKGVVEPAVNTKTWATQRSFNGRKYECFLCHKEFGTLASLNSHLQSPRHEEKIYRCPNRNGCGIEFSALSALTSHVESGKCGVGRFKEVKAVMKALSRSIKRIGN